MNSSVYSILGGPQVRVTRFHRLKPFARVLLGAIVTRGSGFAPLIGLVNAAAPRVTTIVSTSTEQFGLSAGGGVDLPFSRSWAIRAQADWLRDFTGTNRSSFVKTSAGVACRF